MCGITPRRRKLRIEVKVYHKFKICFELIFYGLMEKISKIKVWDSLKYEVKVHDFFILPEKNVNGSLLVWTFKGRLQSCFHFML